MQAGDSWFREAEAKVGLPLSNWDRGVLGARHTEYNLDDTEAMRLGSCQPKSQAHTLARDRFMPAGESLRFWHAIPRSSNPASLARSPFVSSMAPAFTCTILRTHQTAPSTEHRGHARGVRGILAFVFTSSLCTYLFVVLVVLTAG